MSRHRLLALLMLVMLLATTRHSLQTPVAPPSLAFRPIASILAHSAGAKPTGTIHAFTGPSRVAAYQPAQSDLSDDPVADTSPELARTLWLLTRGGLVALLATGAAALGYHLRGRRMKARSRELERQIAERTRELAAVNAIAEVVSHSLHLDDILTDALDKTLEVMGIEAGGVYLLDEDTGVLIIAAQQGLTPDFVAAIDRLRVGEGFSGRVAQTGEPLVVRDASTDARLTGTAVAEQGVHSLVVVPLEAKGEVLGTLFAAIWGYREFDDQDVHLLVAIGHQIGIAVENARLFEAASRRAEQFRVISEVGRRFTSVTSIECVLHQVVELIRSAFRYDNVGIATVEDGVAVYRVGTGRLWESDDEGFQSARFKTGEEGITGWVAGTGEPLLVPDVRNEPRYIPLRGCATRSELTVPIKLKGEVIGVLDAQSTRLNAFDESDLTVLQSLADQAAIAIENAELYEQARRLAVVQERQRLARELHDSVTQALYGVSLYAEAAARQLSAGAVNAAIQHMHDVRDTAQEALREMRLLIFELRPSVLENEGLVAAVRARLEAVEERAGLSVSFRVEGDTALSPAIEEGLYRIARETLNNALKHAAAQNIHVSLEMQGDAVVLEIVDDGVGFDARAAVNSGGLGLEGMRERAAQIGGEISLESEPGGGTRVRVEVAR